MVGSELKVVGSKRMLTLFEGVNSLGVTVVVGIYLLTTFATLALDCEAYLYHTILSLNHGRCANYTVLQVVKTILEPCIVVANTCVVVGRCTESVELRTIAFADDLLTTIHKVGNSTSSEVDIHFVTLTLHIDRLISLSHAHGRVRSSHSLHGRSLNVGTLHTELLFHLYIALLSPRHILALKELYLYEIFAIGVEVCVVIV